MRSCRVVRASGCQWRSRNTLGFDPSILRHYKIWGAAVLSNVYKKWKKSYKIPLKKKNFLIWFDSSFANIRVFYALLTSKSLLPWGPKIKNTVVLAHLPPFTWFFFVFSLTLPIVRCRMYLRLGRPYPKCISSAVVSSGFFVIVDSRILGGFPLHYFRVWTSIKHLASFAE